MAILKTNPILITGKWAQGYALDIQTLHSEFLGYDDWGHKRFDTTRTDVGEAVYKLKYDQNANFVQDLADTSAAFVRAWKCGINVIIPVPSSKQRAVSPVVTVGKAVAAQLGCAFAEQAVARTQQLPELKSIEDPAERERLLAGAHSFDARQVRGCRVLLFDDLYRSGATMNSVTDGLIKNGAVAVFALAMTKTRSNR